MTSCAPTPSRLWPGIACALGSAFLFGASTPLAKQLLGSTDPVLLAGLLYLGAGVGLGAVLAARRLAAPGEVIVAIDRSNWPWLLASIAFGGIAGPILLMLGLVRGDAATTSLLLNVEAAATMAIAWIAFRENVDRRLLLGAGLILCGSVLLSWSGEGGAVSLGAVLVVLACLAWGIDNNLTRHLSSADPVLLVMIKGLAAGAVSAVLGLLQGAVLPAGVELLSALILGFVSYGLSIVLFVLALRHLGTARTGAYFSTAPFVGALIAVAFFGAPLTWIVGLAGLVMAAGTWLHVTERHEHTHTHDDLEHSHTHVHDAHHQHAHSALDPVGEPHAHRHVHAQLTHSHPHYPDLHHRHDH